MIWTYCSCGWIVNVRITVRRSEPSPESILWRKGKGGRLENLRLYGNLQRNEKAASYRNEAALEIKSRLLFSGSNFRPAGACCCCDFCASGGTHFPALASCRF